MPLDAFLARSLRAFFVGDALSMPAHWFYSTSSIDEFFPEGLRQFYAAPASHPSSIMNLHSTAGGGRGSQGGAEDDEVVGTHILTSPGKRDRWGVPNMHYHAGMPAGENTLNLHCGRALLRCIAEHKTYAVDRWALSYIDFMRRDEHPDTYAESYHRAFFRNLQKGRDATQCGDETHDTPSIGGLVAVAPLALWMLSHPETFDLAQVQSQCRRHLDLTHPHPLMHRVSDAYVQVLHDLHRLRQRDGESDRKAVEAAARSVLLNGFHCIDPQLGTVGTIASLTQRSDRDVTRSVFSPACYIDGSWPLTLYFALKYFDQDPAVALAANASVGGDNCHRGAVLGTIMGLLPAIVPAGHTRLLDGGSAIPAAATQLHYRVGDSCRICCLNIHATHRGRYSFKLYSFNRSLRQILWTFHIIFFLLRDGKTILGADFS